MKIKWQYPMLFQIIETRKHGGDVRFGVQQQSYLPGYRVHEQRKSGGLPQI